MAYPQKLDRLIARFPTLCGLAPDHLEMIGARVRFPTMRAGDTAYEPDWDCPNYLACLDGRTRVFKMSAAGREVLIYKVVAGGTCVLTTQCLLSGGTFPAMSIAEADTTLAAVPAPVFGRLMAESDPFRAATPRRISTTNRWA